MDEELAMTSNIYGRRLTVAIALTVGIFLLAMAANAATIQLPKNTEIKIKFIISGKISSKTLVKDVPLLIELAEPIQVGGKILVEAGAKGNAKVGEVRKAGEKDEPGYIRIDFIDLDQKGDTYKTTGKIKLTGNVEGKGKSGKKLLFLKKKTQGEIPADGIYTAKIAESIVFESK